MCVLLLIIVAFGLMMLSVAKKIDSFLRFLRLELPNNQQSNLINFLGTPGSTTRRSATRATTPQIQYTIHYTLRGEARKLEEEPNFLKTIDGL
jgi:hypothetical protein